MRTLLSIAFLLFACLAVAQSTQEVVASNTEDAKAQQETATEEKTNSEITSKELFENKALKISVEERDLGNPGGIEPSSEAYSGDPTATGSLIETPENTQSPLSISKPPQLKGSSIAVKVVFTLLGIIILIVGLALLAKRIGVTGVTVHQDMRILSSLSLGQREKVVLIEVLGEKILLGSSSGSVNKLHVFENHQKNTQIVSDVDDELQDKEISSSEEKQNQEDYSELDIQNTEKTSNFSKFFKKMISPPVIPR